MGNHRQTVKAAAPIGNTAVTFGNSAAQWRLQLHCTLAKRVSERVAASQSSRVRLTR